MSSQRDQLLWVGSQANFDNPPREFFVAAPVVVRRVIVEAPRSIQESDPFARAVVNLATAGVQRINDIAELTGIQDIEFLNEIVRRLADRGVVRIVRGTIEVVGDSKLEDVVGERHVWYLVQDEYTGRLWPRVAGKVQHPERGAETTIVELGTPGRPSPKRLISLPSGGDFDDPDAQAVRSAIYRHLTDVRTVGFKHGKPGTEHLAMLGTPERKPSFSAILAPGREHARLLMMLRASGDSIVASDPFGVGAFTELNQWSALMLELSPKVQDIVIKWSQRRPSRSETSRPDANDALLHLADRLRQEIAESVHGAPVLTHDAAQDKANVERRWRELGFKVPNSTPRLVPALVERAAEGNPADLHVLFYAWTLVVSTREGQELAQREPNLPAMLGESASGQTRTAIPQLKSAADADHRITKESR